MSIKSSVKFIILCSNQEAVALEVAEAVIGALKGELAATAVNAPMVSAEVISQEKHKIQSFKYFGVRSQNRLTTRRVARDLPFNLS